MGAVLSTMPHFIGNFDRTHNIIIKSGRCSFKFLLNAFIFLKKLSYIEKN